MMVSALESDLDAVKYKDEKIQWNLLSLKSLKDAMDGVTFVISCVGSLGSNSYMYKINATANINAIRAAADRGVKRFVYISTADFGLVNGWKEEKIKQQIGHRSNEVERPVREYWMT